MQIHPLSPEREQIPPIATEVKQLDDWAFDARLYHLSQPYKGHDYVIASSVIAMFTGPETYLFAAHEDGEPKGFSELPGSYRGGMCHERLFENIGYKIEKKAEKV